MLIDGLMFYLHTRLFYIHNRQITTTGKHIIIYISYIVSMKHTHTHTHTHTHSPSTVLYFKPCSDIQDTCITNTLKTRRVNH